VRFTSTNPGAGYRNGERGIVEEIGADGLSTRRSDGTAVRVTRNQALSLDYSYAVTGHSAQGLDASRVVLEKDAESRTTHHRSFYTDLTRARDEAVVVTDSAGRLAQRVSRDATKVAALDVATSSERAGIREREFGGD
jgi:ATP-dependent exoDNAse (exonuclease V) alpha subunit